MKFINKNLLLYYSVVFFTLFECFLYIYSYMNSADDGAILSKYNDSQIVVELLNDSPAEKSGLRLNDKIISIENKKPIMLVCWSSVSLYKPNDIITFTVERDKKTFPIKIKLNSDWNLHKDFYIVYYFLVLIVIFIGIFILLKNPNESSSKIFFIFSQIFAICLNSVIFITDYFSLIRNLIFISVYPFLGAVLIHFFLVFPDKLKLNDKYPAIIKIIYGISFLFSLQTNITFIKYYNNINYENDLILMQAVDYSLNWMGLNLLLAMIIAIYKYLTTKEVIAFNQLRWIMLGVIFGLLPETIFGLYPPSLHSLELINPFLGHTAWAIGAIILLVCLSFAIVKYRIWDIEVIIKKGLLYTSISIFLVSSYLIFIFLSELFFAQADKISKLIGITFTAFLFVPTREFLQIRIDKLFHREKYEPTTAVLNFEHNIIGKYDYSDLLIEITKQLDLIFHFDSFFILLKENDELKLNVTTAVGKAKSFKLNSFQINNSIEQMLLMKFPFSIKEMKEATEEYSLIKNNIVVPLIFENKILGCFVCGEKLSEKPYSNQDIDLLKLLANRSATILEMSVLYSNELERRTLIERERTRISKDMHDEVGSSLTKISIMSELMKNELNDKEKIKATIEKISETSREVIDNISEIVWTINPKNDKLDNLASYIREFIYEYLEGTNIKCLLEVQDDIPSINLSAEFRRNVFLVIKESFNNIVKHSKASSVKFNFSYINNELKIEISDNGIGFDEKNLNQFGNGLNNMQKRIDEIGGIININSEKEKGTRVEIKKEMKSDNA